ncbi:hypothetical protein PHO31112_01641 [Pandoraea horticolens]|uniref:KilA-N domain-containing protein n=1 Tax=Pandoraea horticolens TaxID=2508298 RepID=A0A5E4TUG0_9BURK|nr:KilA-N domain-containing protein [Pandoraea horticolens]VVD91427.1 hypothetical protein PHO31112_01641 [Pandoraea horticolens]
MTALVLSGIGIRQDAEGRYCLNDLHRAAGGMKRHAPNEFMRLPTSAELVTELTGDPRFAPVDSQRGGTVPGTFVVKELVYAYAMWISPAFHLKVIRAYDQLVTAPPPVVRKRPISVVCQTYAVRSPQSSLVWKIAK